MTRQEAAVLLMPAGRQLEFNSFSGEWEYCGFEDCALSHIAVYVANGYLPRDVFDYAWGRCQGEDKPAETPQDRMLVAARVLAAYLDEEGYPDKLASAVELIVGTEATEPCPRCGEEAIVRLRSGKHRAYCQSGHCDWTGPEEPRHSLGVTAHNIEARAIVEARTLPVKEDEG